MKIGVKTFRSYEFLKHFEKTADFFEVQAIQTVNYGFLKEFSMPMVIHAEHIGFGINAADKKLINENIKSINFARKLADKTKAKKIIFHPGDLIDKDCSIDNAIKLVKKLNDKRIILENLTPLNNGLGKTPREMKEILEKSDSGFCFDFNHAIATANQMKIDPIKMIKDFLKLKPDHYHIGGQKINSISDNHETFKNSDIPVKEILSLLPRDSEITLEVTKEIEKTEFDLRYIKDIIKQI